MHYAHYQHSHDCYHCGTKLAIKQWDEGGVSSSHNEGRAYDFVSDKQEWLDSPDCCRFTNPVTMAIFEESSSEFSSFGFDEERINISDELLAERMQELTPLVRRNGKIYRFELPDLRRTAFTWDPKLLDEVKFEEVIVTPTFHGCGHYALFKPSISEVVAQVPHVIDKQINAFFIENGTIRITRDGSGHIVPTHWGSI